MLRADNITQDIREEWARALGCQALVTDEDYTDRLLGVLPHTHDRGRVVVLLRPVGPDYSSGYRGWVTLRRADRFAAMSSRPAGYRVVYAMVGLAPDGRIWWSALYDEAKLPVGDAEPMLGDRFYRLRPDEAAVALVEEFDHMQLTLPFEQQSLGADEFLAWQPPSAKAIEAPIGSQISMRGTVVKHNAGGSVTVDFGSVKWAIVGVTPVTVES